MEVNMRSRGRRRRAPSAEESEHLIRVEDLHCGPLVGGFDWLRRLFKGADIGSILPMGHHSNNKERRSTMRRAKSASHTPDLRVSLVFPLAADLDRNPASINLRSPLSSPTSSYPSPARITGMHLWLILQYSDLTPKKKSNVPTIRPSMLKQTPLFDSRLARSSLLLTGDWKLQAIVIALI
ncbi:hypothetical protein R1sor_007519 [Riccia sorocarpa]|uniref:Uncharacterized protein n=1 Tax=Riccia sorocarpa TaxID=122646 RepID=A0ABD3HR22_9MARC